MAAKKRAKKELYKLEHRSFWIVLGMVFLLSIFTILSLLNSDNLTGHATVQNIAYAEEGSNLFFEIRNVHGMLYADIELLETIKESQIVFSDEELMDFDGKIFNSFKVSSKDSSKFGSVTYTLKIKTADLLPAGINLNDIKLYVNGVEADTIKTSTQGEYTFYTAKLEKFEQGDYVIGSASLEKQAVEQIVVPEKNIDEKTINKDAFKEESEEQAEKQETRGALAGKAVQPSESKAGFFRKIAGFFRNLFG